VNPVTRGLAAGPAQEGACSGFTPAAVFRLRFLHDLGQSAQVFGASSLPQQLRDWRTRRCLRRVHHIGTKTTIAAVVL
jgi:hypothetical protein